MSALDDYFIIMLAKATPKCTTLVLAVYFDSISPFERSRSLKRADPSGQFVLGSSGPVEVSPSSTSLSSGCTRKLFYSLIPGHLPI